MGKDLNQAEPLFRLGELLASFRSTVVVNNCGAKEKHVMKIILLTSTMNCMNRSRDQSLYWCRLLVLASFIGWLGLPAEVYGRNVETDVCLSLKLRSRARMRS